MIQTRTVLSCAVGLATCAGMLHGWGSKPHSDIVNAALSTIPAEDRLLQRLGEDGPRLAVFVQMGDWNDCYVEMPERWTVSGASYPGSPQMFYANDYLVFPGLPQLHQHMLPEVKTTYTPLFDRALQALRTESPANAARWIGSLLHYVTDSGSPPHTANILGESHTRMENWLDASRLPMRGYTPKLLGETDDESRRAFLNRMDALAAFSRERAAKLKPLIEAGDRAPSEPLIMESAAETARVTADLIHTLLVRSSGEDRGAALEAEVIAPENTGMPATPAKLILLGTPYSTMSETVAVHDGKYYGHLTLRGLPPGSYTAAISRPGAKLLTVTLTIPARQRWTLESSESSGNRLRNPDFQLRWVDTKRPDYWRYDTRRKFWISDNVLVTAGKGYAFSVTPVEAQSEVMLEWMPEHWRASGPPVAFLESITAPAGTHYVRVLVKGEQDPRNRVHQISVRELE